MEKKSLESHAQGKKYSQLENERKKTAVVSAFWSLTASATSTTQTSQASTSPPEQSASKSDTSTSAVPNIPPDIATRETTTTSTTNASANKERPGISDYMKKEDVSKADIYLSLGCNKAFIIA